jgi:hypothetical protein
LRHVLRCIRVIKEPVCDIEYSGALMLEENREGAFVSLLEGKHKLRIGIRWLRHGCRFPSW